MGLEDVVQNSETRPVGEHQFSVVQREFRHVDFRLNDIPDLDFSVVPTLSHRLSIVGGGQRRVLGGNRGEYLGGHRVLDERGNLSLNGFGEVQHRDGRGVDRDRRRQ